MVRNELGRVPGEATIDEPVDDLSLDRGSACEPCDSRGGGNTKLTRRAVLTPCGNGHRTVYPDDAMQTLVLALTTSDPGVMEYATASVVAYYLIIRGHTLSGIRGGHIQYVDNPPGLQFALAAEKNNSTSTMRKMHFDIVPGSSAFLLNVLVRWLRCRRGSEQWATARATRGERTAKELLAAVPADEQVFAFAGSDINDQHLDAAAKQLYINKTGHDHRRGAYSAAIHGGLAASTVAAMFGWSSGAHTTYFRHFPPTDSGTLFSAHLHPREKRPPAAVFDGKTFRFPQ